MRQWKSGLKPDFTRAFCLSPAKIFVCSMGETNGAGRKISFALFAFEVQIFQLLRNFLTAKPIRLLELRGHYTRINKSLQNGRPTALRGLRKDRPRYILRTRTIEFQTSFRLLHFFAGTLRKWRLICLPRNFSLTKNCVSDGRKV